MLFRSAGPTADDNWRDYEKAKGNSYMQALDGFAAGNVFSFDKRHLETAHSVLLVLPAGKSAHLELGWCLGKGKPGCILLDSPERWDVMYKFATRVSTSLHELMPYLTGK